MHGALGQGNGIFVGSAIGCPSNQGSHCGGCAIHGNLVSRCGSVRRFSSVQDILLGSFRPPVQGNGILIGIAAFRIPGNHCCSQSTFRYGNPVAGSFTLLSVARIALDAGTFCNNQLVAVSRASFRIPCIQKFPGIRIILHGNGVFIGIARSGIAAVHRSKSSLIFTVQDNLVIYCIAAIGVTACDLTVAAIPGQRYNIA